MRCTILLLAISVYLASGYPPHPAVVAVRREEEQLPQHLRKSALRNPRLWEILPLTSVLHHGEKLVTQREADRITRESIYKMLSHAGFVRRGPHQLRQPPLFQMNHEDPHQEEDLSSLDELLSNPEFLQHL